MFGVQLSGPSACSEFDDEDSTQELCVQQIQMAAFMPFFRLARNNDTATKELTNLKDGYKTLAQNALLQRLSFSRLIYGCLFEASRNGQSCVDPLFFHYPTYDAVYKNEETEFILANALKVTPKLVPGDKVTGFFPKGSWVNVHKFNDIIKVTNENGESKELDAKTDINVYMMPGTAIPYLPNTDGKFKTTHDINANGDVHVLINRDENGQAKGKMFFDDGISEH